MKKIVVVYIGIRHIASDTVHIDTRKKNKRWSIGFVGTIVQEKGIKEFLDVIPIITQKHAYASFCVIGDGRLLGWAKMYARMLKIQEKVIFTGYVENMTDNFGRIDLLYFPTNHHEGLSLALLEASAMGKIVVARDIGGNRELVIDKKTGFLFKTDKEGQEILEGIITDKISTKGIREAALAHVRKNFNMDIQVKKFIKVFRG